MHTETLIVTADDGATVLQADMVVAPPDRLLTTKDLADQVQLDDVNTSFLLGILSASLAHERAGVALYRVAQEHCTNPELKARFGEFERSALEQLGRYERLVAALGGSPTYLSQAARMTEQVDSNLLAAPTLLAGSVDPMVFETAFLEVMMIAQQRCVANGRLLASVGETLPEGSKRLVAEAAATMLPTLQRNLEWTTETWIRLATANVEQPGTSGAVGLIERAASKVKDAFS